MLARYKRVIAQTTNYILNYSVFPRTTKLINEMLQQRLTPFGNESNLPHRQGRGINANWCRKNPATYLNFYCVSNATPERNMIRALKHCAVAVSFYCGSQYCLGDTNSSGCQMLTIQECYFWIWDIISDNRCSGSIALGQFISDATSLIASLIHLATPAVRSKASNSYSGGFFRSRKRT